MHRAVKPRSGNASERDIKRTKRDAAHVLSKRQTAIQSVVENVNRFRVLAFVYLEILVYLFVVFAFRLFELGRKLPLVRSASREETIERIVYPRHDVRLAPKITMHKVTTAPKTVGGSISSNRLATAGPPVRKEYESSSSDEDGYLSPFNGSDDGSGVAEGSLLDEMPPFSACSMSPSARSLSPIELEPFESPTSTPKSGRSCYSGCSTPLYGMTPPPPVASTTGTNGQQPAEGYVTLDEIHARIGLTPPDGNVSRSRLNLETIFEGVFLETPPKKEFQSKGNLFRRSLRNRALLFEKVEKL
ncbi:uncharacterized protein LOC5667444 [Anopheles gambiae]|uniref:uncharacterized protein LOC5667444 n=1 Tax=Anopheles gambiae TaxID=7165 RepID=UPI002AC905D6|nr:uncharacterized protein LOC5667444 [Anopheles gambiae]